MKTIGRVMQPLPPHHLMILYICTKFQENIYKGFRIIKRTHILKFTQGHNSIKNICGVTVLVLCTMPYNTLYLSQVLRKYLKGSVS